MHPFSLFIDSLQMKNFYVQLLWIFTFNCYYSLSLSLTPTPFLSSYLSLPSHREERETLWKGLLLLLVGFAQLCVFFSIFNQKLSSLPIFSTLFPYSKFIFFYFFFFWGLLNFVCFCLVNLIIFFLKFLLKKIWVL